MPERRQRSAERLGSERRKPREEEGGEPSARATPSRRVLTVQIPRTEDTSQKKVLETIEKVFRSVLETSEIRAYDVSVTANEAENKKTYRYKAPAPSFPFVPKSIGKLSETGVCEITEVVVCDVKGKRIENVCETKVDAFEGEPWSQSMVDEIDAKIESIKAANPKPKRRQR